MFPWSVGDCIGVQGSMDLALMCSSLDIRCNHQDIFARQIGYRATSVSGNEFLGFIATWMSSCNCVVMSLKDIFTKSLVSGDVDPFLPFD